MLFRANAAAIAIAVLMAGCVSPREQAPPVWSDINTVVSPGPIFPVGAPVEPPAESPAPVPAKPAQHTNVAVIPPAIQMADSLFPLQRWSRVNGFAPPVQLSGAPFPSYALQSTNGVFVLHIGSQLAQWDRIELRLGFAPELIDGQPYVHSLDLYKTVQPLLQGEPLAAGASTPVIVIDPGHGGENAGTKSVLGNRYEKEFTLDWALRLQSVLIANNCKAFLTRSGDTDLALSNRVAFATQHKADVFLSLHFNSAASNEVEAGLETYCLTPAGMPSSLTRGFQDEIHEVFPNNGYDIQNLFLALRVHRALLEVNGHRDRGIRRARFPGVLRGQQRPAILIEGGYLSNPQEARLIADPAYRQKLAEAVAKALLVRPNSAVASAAQGFATQALAAPTVPSKDGPPQAAARARQNSGEAEATGQSADASGQAAQ